jgi:HPt (histidine-containing phosphotransfer) domain-containing protein
MLGNLFTGAWRDNDRNEIGENRARSAAPLMPEAGRVIDLEYLGLFTNGDAEEERLMANLFIATGVEALETLRRHVRNGAANDDWRQAAHKLRGAAGQIGATLLSAACVIAEACASCNAAEKQAMLHDIEKQFAQVQHFFSIRFQ